MASRPYDASSFPLEGRCACGAVRYRMTTPPIIVHGCHCSFCQRETGAAFAVNAVIESDRVELLGEEPERVETPSASGKGQIVCRCGKCHVAVWSHYAVAGDGLRFVRVGTLGRPGLLPPDIHIYTSTKVPWLTLPEGAASAPEFYKPHEVWSQDDMARWRAARSR